MSRGDAPLLRQHRRHELIEHLGVPGEARDRPPLLAHRLHEALLQGIAEGAMTVPRRLDQVLQPLRLAIGIVDGALEAAMQAVGKPSAVGVEIDECGEPLLQPAQLRLQVAHGLEQLQATIGDDPGRTALLGLGPDRAAPLLDDGPRLVQIAAADGRAAALQIGPLLEQEGVPGAKLLGLCHLRRKTQLTTHGVGQLDVDILVCPGIAQVVADRVDQGAAMRVRPRHRCERRRGDCRAGPRGDRAQTR